MSRRFNGSGSGPYIDTTIGNVGQLGAGAFSLMFLTKLASVANHGLVRADTQAPGVLSQGGANFGVNPFSDGRTYLTLAGFTSDNGSIAAYTATDGWVIYVITKAAGSAIPRWHRYKFNTNTWEHGSGGAGTTLAPETNNVPTRVRFGWLTSGDWLDGWLGAAAFYNAVISDATLDNTAALRTSLPAWLGLPNLVGAWRFDRHNVRDLSGGSAHQGGINGTTAAPAEEPAGWSYATGTETLWLPSDGPSGGDFLDATDGVPTISTGVSFTVSAPGTIDAIRFYATANAATGGGNYIANLHEVTADDNTPAGTLLGTSPAVPSTEIASGAWNEIALPSPVAVVPGRLYRGSVYSGTSGRYVATTGYFTGVDKTSAGGHVTAHHNGDNPTGLGTQNQGVFTIGGGSPTDMPFHTTGANYWIDVVYTLTGGGGGGGRNPGGDFMPFFGR